MRHHLAMLYGHYISEILAGRKTIECRFGTFGYPPHGMVAAGDLIWLKAVSGPVHAVASVSRVESIRPLTPERISWIRDNLNGQIGASDEFWGQKFGASMATLVWLSDVCAFQPFSIRKRDRRAWVVLAEPPIPGQSVVSARMQLA